MLVTCQLCGQQAEVGKWREEHEKARRGAPFICETCSARVRKQAQDQRKRLV